MGIDKNSFNLNEDQERELLNLTGNFLQKHFPKEVTSRLEIEINFSHKPEKEFLLRKIHGCNPSPGARDNRCDPDFAWSD